MNAKLITHFNYWEEEIHIKGTLWGEDKDTMGYHYVNYFSAP